LESFIHAFLRHADIGHLALVLCIALGWFQNGYLQRELTCAGARFDEFVRELARFNRRNGDD